MIFHGPDQVVPLCVRHKARHKRDVRASFADHFPRGAAKFAFARALALRFSKSVSTSDFEQHMPTKILVVEDQADIRLMTRIMLEWSGYEVIEARDGYEALLSAEKHCPDVILMDIGMPIMDGVRSAELIRATKNCGATPIIAVTAFDNEYLESLGNFRFHHIIRKPIEREHLQQILNDIAPPSA